MLDHCDFSRSRAGVSRLYRVNVLTQNSNDNDHNLTEARLSRVISSSNSFKMADSKTIAALKTNFLRQQIRILSQPLKLSDRAKERADLPDGDLREIMLRGTSPQALQCRFEAYSDVVCSKSNTKTPQQFSL
jgi:hypothetical protein